jgi:hypothetical protein
MVRYFFRMFGMKCIKWIHYVEVMFARLLVCLAVHLTDVSSP